MPASSPRAARRKHTGFGCSKTAPSPSAFPRSTEIQSPEFHAWYPAHALFATANPGRLQNAFRLNGSKSNDPSSIPFRRSDCRHFPPLPPANHRTKKPHSSTGRCLGLPTCTHRNTSSCAPTLRSQPIRALATTFCLRWTKCKDFASPKYFRSSI